MSSPYQYGCKWCGGPPSCLGCRFVYEENPNETPETITEVVEIASSQSTPLVPPPDFSEYSSRLDSHSDHHVGFVDSLNEPIPLHNSQMESLIPCVGCGEPLFGSPCRWCTCVQCGNDIHNGSCLFCGSRNSFDYDPNPNSFNDPSNFSNYPPQPVLSSYNQHNCCEYCGGLHPSFECQSGNTFVYEQFSGDNQNLGFDQYPHYFPNHSQQSYCCKNCGGPHDNLQCQPWNQNYYTSSFDNFQPPQHHTVQTPPEPSPKEISHNFETTMKKLDDILQNLKNQVSGEKTIGELLAEEREARKSREELLALEHAALKRAQFLKAIMYDDDEDSYISFKLPQSVVIPAVKIPSHTTAITPEASTHSLKMGDELLDTVPERESDEFIKSSVENLVPIPRESQGISDHMCDSSFPLECSNDQFETFSNCSEDCASYGDIEYVEASLPQSDADHLLEEFTDELTQINPLSSESEDGLFDFKADLGDTESLLDNDRSLTSHPNNPNENVDHFVPEKFKATFTNPLFEFESEFTWISNNPIFDEDGDEFTMEHEFTNSHHVNDSLHEEFAGELTHIMTPPEYDCLDGKNHDRGEKFSIMRVCISMTNFPTLPPEMLSKPKSSTYKIQTSATALDPEEEDLIMIVIMIFLPFFTYLVTSSLLHSFGSEDIIFDPGIFIYHF